MFSFFRTVPSLGNGTAVRGYQIASTTAVIFEGLETIAGHSTITTAYPFGWDYSLDGGNPIRLGKISTRKLPAEVAAMPFGPERSIACTEKCSRAYTAARRAILAALPTAGVEIDAGHAKFNGAELICEIDVAERMVEALSATAAA